MTDDDAGNEDALADALIEAKGEELTDTTGVEEMTGVENVLASKSQSVSMTPQPSYIQPGYYPLASHPNPYSSSRLGTQHHSH